jgi:hypothetical protein
MSQKSLCRIGVYYDGAYFGIAQRYFYRDRSIGWLDYRRFHALIEKAVWKHERRYPHHRVVRAAWFDAVTKPSEPSAQALRFDRRRTYDLMYSGIEATYLPKGANSADSINVALAVQAMSDAWHDTLDVAVLVTGSADLVPLVRSLMQHDIRVMVVYFQFEGESTFGYVSDYLLSACNWSLDFVALERDEEMKDLFLGAFRQPDEEW